MLELKGTFKCSVCGHKVEGINMEVCPNCKSKEMYPIVSADELRILPKVSEMAGRIDSDEALEKAKEVFANTTYHEAFGILDEAKELLEVYLKKRSKIRMGPGELGVITSLGKEIGEIASGLDALRKHDLGIL